MVNINLRCIFGVDDVEIISVDGSNLIFKGFTGINLRSVAKMLSVAGTSFARHG